MRALLGSEYDKNGYICCREDGKLIQPDYLSKQFCKVSDACGLERIRFHDLRHSAASMLIMEGFKLVEVSELLGHCDIGTTVNVYGHLQFQSKVKMAKRMEELLLCNEAKNKKEIA